MVLMALDWAVGSFQGFTKIMQRVMGSSLLRPLQTGAVLLSADDRPAALGSRWEHSCPAAANVDVAQSPPEPVLPGARGREGVSGVSLKPGRRQG